MAAAAAAAATGLHTLVRNPSPTLLYRHGSPLSRSSSLLPIRGLHPSRRSLAVSLLSADFRRPSRLVSFAASGEESKQTDDVEVESEEDKLASQEAWEQTLESYKQEALKLKDKSQEAYEMFSEKAMVALQETSEKLKIQAEKSRRDLAALSKEIGEEGKVYLASAAKNSPDEVKDIFDAFASADELKHIDEVRDFYVGIPYGGLLVAGGFLSFMLTGSISAIRFGIILGGALLALSVTSLRSSKSGKYSPLLLKGQTAIAAVLFIREWRLFSRGHTFPTILTTFFSGAALAFYIYRVIVDGRNKGPRSEQASE